MEISARLSQFALSNVGELSCGWILSKNIQVEIQKRKINCRCMFTLSIKLENSQLYVKVVQWQKRNAEKSVMHMQSCCLANLNLLVFWCSRCRRNIDIY